MTEIESVIFSQAEIDAAIRRMAEAIARDYLGKTVVLLGVLKGALFVTADLARALDAVSAGRVEVRLTGKVLDLDVDDHPLAHLEGGPEQGHERREVIGGQLVDRPDTADDGVVMDGQRSVRRPPHIELDTGGAELPGTHECL